MSRSANRCLSRLQGLFSCVCRLLGWNTGYIFCTWRVCGRHITSNGLPIKHDQQQRKSCSNTHTYRGILESGITTVHPSPPEQVDPPISLPTHHCVPVLSGVWDQQHTLRAHSLHKPQPRFTHTHFRIHFRTNFHTLSARTQFRTHTLAHTYTHKRSLATWLRKPLARS